jgi:hypothetical protein
MLTKRGGLLFGFIFIASFLPEVVFADNAHFIKGPTASLTNTVDYTVSFKEAGLGSTPVTYTLTLGTGSTFTFQCFTKNGNTPQGDPNGISASGQSTSTTVTPRNGQVTASITLSPEKDGASCQGNGLKLCLVAVDYENVVFADTTNSLTFNTSNLSASGLQICTGF